MKNPILFIVDASNNFLRYTGTIRALNGYTEQIVFITPQPILNTYISASMLPVNRNDNRYEQYVLPSSDSVSDYIETTDALYQTIADWNVFKTDIKQTALAEFSKFRSGNISFAFAIQSVEASSKLLTYKGVFGVDNPLPISNQTIGDYYECEDSEYTLVSGTHTYVFSEGMYVYWNGSRWVKDRLITLGATTSVQIPVEPNHAVGYQLEVDEVLAVENTIAQVVTNTGKIAALEQKDSDILSGVEPFSEITLKDALNNQTSITYASKVALDVEVARLEADKADKTYVDSQDALDEKLSNKATGFAVVNDTLYPSVSAVKTYVDSQDNALDLRLDALELANMFKSATFNSANGVITFTRFDNTTLTIDLPTELIVTSGSYDATTNELVLVLASGGDIRIPVDNLLTDLDASGVRFDGSATNYLTLKTNVQTGMVELDLQIKSVADRVTQNESDIDNLQAKDILLDADILALQTKDIEHEKDLIDHEQRIDSIEAITRKQDSDIASIDDDGIGILHMGKDVAETTVTTKIEGLLLDSEQLVTNGDGSSTTGWSGFTATLSSSGGILSATGNGGSSSVLAYQTPLINGIKYYAISKARVTDTVSTSLQLRTGSGQNFLSQAAPVQNTWYVLSGILTVTSTEIGIRSNYTDSATQNGKVLEIDYAYAFNITQLQANKQYSPLYSTTFDLMSDAQIKAQMDLWVANGTLPNSIMAVDMDKRVTSVGKNLFDGEFELGTINLATGLNISSSMRIRTINKIPVISNETYIISGISTPVAFYFYNDETYISNQNYSFTNTFTVPTNANSVRFVIDSVTDISINVQLEVGTVATTYELFRKSSMYLDSGEVGYSYQGTTDSIEFRNGEALFINRVNDTQDGLRTTPIETPISVIGNAMAYPNGTFLIEDVVRRSGVYSSGITVDKPIKTLDNIYKLNDDGSSTKLAVSGATIAGDGLSFTHTSLSNGDFVWFDYYYQGTNVKGLSTVYHYNAEDDLRFPATTLKQGATSKPDFDYANIGLLFPQNNTSEAIYIVAQLPHDRVVDTPLEPHVHCRLSGAGQPVMKMDYKIYNPSEEAIPASFTTYVMNENTATWTSGTISNMIYGASPISGVGYGDSAIMIIKLYRDDNVYVGDLLVDELDIHYIRKLY